MDRRMLRSLLFTLCQLTLLFGILCGGYVAWMQWWTGIQSAHHQYEMTQQADWSKPDATRIAPPQPGNPPATTQTPDMGALIGELYIPRFGDNWHRTIVQGVSLDELNTHGLGHYPDTALPGQTGNMALAGHRNGYGQPLGDIDRLQPGDPIIIRTESLWLVYRYTGYRIVLPEDTSVLNPPADRQTRMVTLTTCEPKYTTPTHRWIATGMFEHWMRVSDGVPGQLAATNDHGNVRFTARDTPGMLTRLGTLQPVIIALTVAYPIVFIGASIVWRWPAWRNATGRDWDVMSVLWRCQPGPKPIRMLLTGLLALLAMTIMFEYGYPWCATHIPLLRDMSGYSAI